MKTDEEIYKICEEIWKVKNSWNLTYWDFIRYSYTKGNDGGDIVYTAPNGGCLTRFMCHSWIIDWRSFSHGFITAYRLLEKCHLSYELRES
jgi:hypothetical protein